MQTPKVSVIMPIRNEAAHIERSLGAVLAQDYPYLEVLVVDGMSDDVTRDRVLSMIDEPLHQKLGMTLIDNPERTVPYGLNRGLTRAQGDIIVRVDGHCEIPKNYVSRCVRLLEETGAECVGGVIEAIGETETARAIALAQSSPFGVGSAAFRTGRGRARFVDTVAFGAYRKEVFERVGHFDVELVRNQDDEFNFRLIQSDGRIWIDPSLVSRYFTRATIRSLWSQYFQYGTYKVRVMQKRNGLPSFRQLAPGLLVVGLVSTITVGSIRRHAGVASSVALPYAVANLAWSVIASRRDRGALGALPAAFATLHTSYGLGFLDGLWRWRRHFRTDEVATQHA